MPDPLAVARRGAALRLAAARRLDAALAEVAAAEAAYDEATRVIQSAELAGLRLTGTNLFPPPRTLHPRERPVAVPRRYDARTEEREQRAAGLLP